MGQATVLRLFRPPARPTRAFRFLTFSRGNSKPSFTARIERPPFHRGGSESKKDGCLLPRIILIVRVPRAKGHLALPPHPAEGRTAQSCRS